ncbi:MAG: hypothetical protein AUG44_25315 [Actinobacteria bacterium 13_1_20CM_3_71_11]|nr:MAG: hypothetical protein AUG44_25315 [Actinobacteria bacterium 13_1_20CM_3_71_11]
MRRRSLLLVAVTLATLLPAGVGPAHAETVSSRGPALQWNLDEGAGTTTVDNSGHGRSGTLSSSAMWTTTAHSGGWAGNFTRTVNYYVSGPANVIRTDQSFTMAAWVYQDPTAGGADGIVSIAGVHTSAAFLKYDNAGGRNAWDFQMTGSDVAGPVTDDAETVGSMVQGVWTHVVGVYDLSANTMRLYLNGSLNATHAHASPWNATGIVNVGRLHWNDTDQNYMDGKIDDVQLYSRALTDWEVGDLYTSTATAGPALRWDLDTGGGTTAYDKTGNNNYGTLASSAMWTTTAHSNGQAATFDGTSGSYITSRTNAVRTDQSFSVSAWVNLASNAGTAIIATEVGTTSSAFILKFEPGGGINGWAFVMTQSDGTSPTQDIMPATNTGTLNTWTHLVGTFDAGAGTMRLYMNGGLIGAHVHNVLWNATGPVNVGQAMWNGDPHNRPFNGQIDDVRVYPRVLSASEVTDLYNDDVPWSMVDARGTGAAWSATISATALTTAAGTAETVPRSLAVGTMSMVNGTVTAASGSDPTTNVTSTAITMSGSNQVFLNSTGTNKGTYTFSPTVTIAVPANAYRSNYSGAVGASPLNPYTATIVVTVS